eukprot:SAG31_NODE_2145_length_6340_cov_2.456177_1_plen_91_part_10
MSTVPKSYQHAKDYDHDDCKHLVSELNLIYRVVVLPNYNEYEGAAHSPPGSHSDFFNRCSIPWLNWSFSASRENPSLGCATGATLISVERA